MNRAADVLVASARRTRAEIEAEPALLEARRDSNAFCEFCFKDDHTGKPIRQARHHRTWQDLTSKHNRLILWYPIEHGKTTQAKMTLCRLLGQHPNRQYAYVCANETKAVEVVSSVQREIEGNEQLRRVYPRLRPQQRHAGRGPVLWGSTRFRVEGCPIGVKEPSLSAYGLDSGISGSRLHGAILDNILVAGNVESEGRRRHVLNVIQDTIRGRILEGGFIWLIDTAWYEDDALHELAKRPGWTAVKFSAEEGENEGETLWPERWPWRRLNEIRGEVGQTAYDRQFKNIPLGESMAFFKKEQWKLARGRCLWRPRLPDTAGLPRELRTGVDLATRKGEENDLTSLTTIAPIGIRRQLLHIEADRMEGLEILSHIVAIHRSLHMPVTTSGGFARFVVEDNAAQVYIVQLLRSAEILRALGLTEREAAAIRVIGRTTTSNKRDAELGVMGLATELEMGKWDFPDHPQVDNLWGEMQTWHPGQKHYGDRLMSLWLASADLLVQQSERRVEYI